jgi:hypothetical protein
MPRPAVSAVMPAARRSFSSEVNVGLPKVTFRLVTRDAKFASDSPLEQRRFELSVPPGTPAFRGAPDGSRGPAHRSRFRSRAAVIVTLAALPILWTPNVVVARMVVGGFRVVIPGALLFAADGWIVTGYVFVWQIAEQALRKECGFSQMLIEDLKAHRLQIAARHPIRGQRFVQWLDPCRQRRRRH